MPKSFLPFTGTHVANLALNKAIGLVFLQSGPQRTDGLSSISEESFRTDQLQIAAWMIQSFMGPDNIRFGEPWRRFESFDLKAAINHPMLVDSEQLCMCDEMLRVANKEVEALGDRLWDTNHQPSNEFQQRLLTQIEECVAYTKERIELIQNCSREPSDGGTAMVYLATKNAITFPMIFSTGLLKIVLSIVVPKAIKEGYTALIA